MRQLETLAVSALSLLSNLQKAYSRPCTCSELYNCVLRLTLAATRFSDICSFSWFTSQTYWGLGCFHDSVLKWDLRVSSDEGLKVDIENTSCDHLDCFVSGSGRAGGGGPETCWISFVLQAVFSFSVARGIKEGTTLQVRF